MSARRRPPRERVKTVDRLVHQFVASIILSDLECQNLATLRKSRRHSVRYPRIWDRLRMEFRNEGRDAIVPLLRHPRADVRVVAASYLLKYRTNKALPILKKQAKLGRFVAFTASQVLKQWSKGEWGLDGRAPPPRKRGIPRPKPAE